MVSTETFIDMLKHLKRQAYSKYKNINSYTLRKLNMDDEFVKFKYLDDGELKINSFVDLHSLELKIEEMSHSIFGYNSICLEIESKTSTIQLFYKDIFKTYPIDITG